MSKHQDDSSLLGTKDESRATDEDVDKGEERQPCERKIDLTVESRGKRLVSISAVDEEGDPLVVTIMVEDKHGRACCYDSVSGRWYKCRR